MHKLLQAGMSLLAVALLLALPQAAYSQTSEGRITGRVIDPASAVIPGVEIIATNMATGVTYKVYSNSAGIYVLPTLPPGIYVIAATVPGFKKYERKDIEVQTAQQLALDLHMQLGDVTETVEVSSEAPLLESSSATVGQFLDSRQVTQMPLGNRRALELARLAGGVVWINYGGLAKPNFSLAGGRVQNQMFWLDGGNIQNMRLGIGQVDTDPPVEVIREFRVVQNGYSAEYGGSSSGLIVSSTKSGTNEIHGSAFEYFRNDALDAAGFFAPIQNGEKAKAPLRYNLFGGTMGGPIIRDRTHYFAGYEGTRRTDGTTQILTVPTTLQRQGDFSQTFASNGSLIQIYDPATTRVVGGKSVRDPFPGNIIPASRFDAVAKQLIDDWPSPNRPAVNVAGAQNFIGGNRAQKFRRDNVTAKVDHVFSDANRFYFRFLYNRDPYTWTSNYPNPEADPDNNNPLRYQTSYLFTDTHTWKNNLIMDMRYSFGHRISHARSAGLGSNIVEQIGLKGVRSGNWPDINVTGVAGVGRTNERRQFPIRQHQVVNSWTSVRGKHVMKFGTEFRKSLNYEINLPLASGQFSFATTGSGLPGNSKTGYGFASYLLGFVNGFSLRETDVLDRSSWYMAFFYQDDWKLTANLTLNLGLRWETDTPIVDKNNRMNSFDPTAINPVSGTPGVVKFAGVGGWPESPYETDWNNIAPRIGFAWRPKGNDKWVVRGGFGIFYEHPFAHGAPSSASLGFEKSASISSPDNGVTPAFYLAVGPDVTPTSPTRDDSFGAVAVGKKVTTSITYYEPTRLTGYAQQFNFSVQRQLPGNLVLELQYLGNLGRKMPISNLNVNQVPADQMGAGNAQVRRPFPQFNSVAIAFPMIGVNNYHAAVVRMEKRLSHGMSFLGTYTWARNIGNIDESAGGDLGDNQIYQDFYNLKADKGPLAIDIVHRFAWSSVYDLPFGEGRRWLADGLASAILGGWTIGAIASLQSGGPFTVTMQTNTANAFSAGGLRANLLHDPNLPNDQKSLSRWFDTDAFAAPDPYTFGNAGRGIVRSDGRVSCDFSISKNFNFSERSSIQFRGDFFNAFNHPDFSTPNRAKGNAGFGTITGATDPRTIQFGLRFVF